MLENIVPIFDEIIIPLLTIFTSWPVITFILVMSFYSPLNRLLHRVANKSMKDRNNKNRDYE